MDARLDWCVPESCSLPLADQPGRMAEWDAVFAGSVCEVSPANRGVRFTLVPDSVSAAAVADLADREARCCAFLSFTVTIGAGSLTLEVSAPPERADVVSALAARARTLVGSRVAS